MSSSSPLWCSRRPRCCSSTSADARVSCTAVRPGVRAHHRGVGRPAQRRARTARTRAPRVEARHHPVEQGSASSTGPSGPGCSRASSTSPRPPSRRRPASPADDARGRVPGRRVRPAGQRHLGGAPGGRRALPRRAPGRGRPGPGETDTEELRQAVTAYRTWSTRCWPTAGTSATARTAPLHSTDAKEQA